MTNPKSNKNIFEAYTTNKNSRSHAFACLAFEQLSTPVRNRQIAASNGITRDHSQRNVVGSP